MIKIENVHCVDGKGTKLFLDAWMGNFNEAIADAVLMNSNDLATIIYAYPNVLNIYNACQRGVEENHMGEIINGLVDILEEIKIDHAPWNLNIGKMETASLDEMISLGVPNKGVDFGVVMIGLIRNGRIPNLNPKPGYPIVGVASTGMHSNGYTGGRHVLLSPDTPRIEYRAEWLPQYKGRFNLNSKPDILQGKTVLEAMKVRTAEYLVEASLIGHMFDSRDIYGVNVTGNALHNFNRAGERVSFEITEPLPILPIHELLVQESGWNPHTAYKKQNMGMGFAYIVPSLDIAEKIVKLINERGKNKAKIVGEVAKSYDKELKTTLHKPYEGKALTFVGYSN